MIFDALALVSLLTVITMIRRLVGIFPSIMSCMVRWKENLALQHSLRTRTDRDIFATAMLVPFVLTAYRFRMYCPDFMQSLTEDARLGITFAVFAAYLALRVACKYVFRIHRTPNSTYETATESVRTYFVTLTILLMVTGGISSLTDAPLAHIRTAMFWISGAMYLVFLLRKSQIFHSSCSLFVTFLYLCALEILPTGVLIASAVIF